MLSLIFSYPIFSILSKEGTKAVVLFCYYLKWGVWHLSYNPKVTLDQFLPFSAPKIFPEILCPHLQNPPPGLGMVYRPPWREGWHLCWFAPRLPGTFIDRDRCQQGESNKLISLDNLSQKWVDVSEEKEKKKIWSVSAVPQLILFFFKIIYQP